MRADKNNAFLQWITTHNQFTLAKKVAIRVLPEDEDFRCVLSRRTWETEPPTYYTGTDHHIMKTFANEGTCHAANSDTRASTVIRAIVTVCTRWIRRIASVGAIWTTEAIHNIMALYLHLSLRKTVQPTSDVFEEIRMEDTISTKDLKAKLDRKEGIKVVETLAPERYREAHIPGAMNIPPERIKELAPQLLPNKDAEIVTYCTSTH